MVRFEHGKRTHEELSRFGLNTEFHPYPGMGHEVLPQEIDLLREWFKKRIGTGEDDGEGGSEEKDATVAESVSEGSDKKRKH